MSQCHRCEKSFPERHMMHATNGDWCCMKCLAHDRGRPSDLEKLEFYCECGTWNDLDLKALMASTGATPVKCPRCGSHIRDRVMDEEKPDIINHPSHYKGKGLECIQVIEAFDLTFSLGNAVKYILRAGKKHNKKEDLQKAIWYLNRELESIE